MLCWRSTKMTVGVFYFCLIICWLSMRYSTSTGNKTMARVGVIFHGENSMAKKPEQVVHCAGTLCIELSWLFLEPFGHIQNLDKDFFSEGFDGMVSAVSCRQTIVIDVIAQKYRIPHVCVSSGPCVCTADWSQFTVPFDRTSVLPDIARDLVLAARWTRIGLAFGSSADKASKRHCVTELSVAGAEVHPFVLNDVGTRNSRILETMPPNLVFISAHQNILKALRKQTLAVRSSWFFLDCDLSTSSVLDIIGGSDMITAYLVRASGRACSSRDQCSDGEDRLMSEIEKMGVRQGAAEGVLLLWRTITWIQTQTDPNQVWTCKQQGCRIAEGLRRLIPKQCFEVVRVQNFPRRSAVTVGRWTPDGGFQERSGSGHLGLLKSFDGRKLKIALTGVDVPYVARRSINSYEGLAVDILSDLAFTLNFTRELVESPDGLYGAPVDTDNGSSWNGMIGMVIRGEVDLAIGTFTVTHQRAEVIDFTTAFMQQSVGILAKSPETSPHLFQFLKPFSNTVWLVIVGLVVLSGFILWIMDLLTTPNRDEQSSKTKHLLDYAILTVSSVFGQGPTFHPSTASARCLLGFLLVFTMLVLAMYTAHLAAVLTVATPVKPVDSLQDLDQRTDLNVLVEYGTSTWTLFEHSKQDLYKRINARKVASKHIAESLDLVKEGDNVFIGGRASLQFWVANSCGRLRMADERFFGGSYAFVLPKQSPYKDAINHRLLKMSEHGIIDSLVDKWLHPMGNCSGKSSDRNPSSLRMDNLGGMLLAYGVIATLAVCILIAEVVQCKLIQFIVIKTTAVESNR